MKTSSVKEKLGLSIIVLVVFSLIILSIIITVSLMVMNAADYARLNNNKNNNMVYEQNAMQEVEEPTVIDFSACYIVEDDVAVIRIQDNSSDIVMFTCMKVYDGQIPNVVEADWEYTNTFVAPDSGEYLIYAKDVQGNISDAVVVNVEI